MRIQLQNYGLRADELVEEYSTVSFHLGLTPTFNLAFSMVVNGLHRACVIVIAEKYNMSYTSDQKRNSNRSEQSAVLKVFRV